MYWHQKGAPPFIGGRGNTKNFFSDIGARSGVKIDLKLTTSAKKGEEALLSMLAQQLPVFVYGDMAFLPWFDFPGEYHFGGHTFVVCGYDGKETVLASDIDQKAGGLKKGFYYPMTLEQLRQARNSPFKPFPPNNAYLTFDFQEYHSPSPGDIYGAIGQTVEAMLLPPISNFGIRGLRRTPKELKKWPLLFDDFTLRMTLFNVYIFVEIGGTGGGCFRYMYSRFLKEAAVITGDSRFSDAAEGFQKSGQLFTKLGLLFKDAETASDIPDRIEAASAIYLAIADLEEQLFDHLHNALPGKSLSSEA